MYQKIDFESMPTFQTIMAEVFGKSRNYRDIETTLAEVLAGMNNLSSVNLVVPSGSDGDGGEEPEPLVLSLPKAQLSKLAGLMDMPLSLLSEPPDRLTIQQKLAIMDWLTTVEQEGEDGPSLVPNSTGRKEVILRTAGEKIWAIVTGDYAVFSNVAIIGSIGRIHRLGLNGNRPLPEDLRVMGHQVRERDMYLRIVSPEWRYNLPGPGGNGRRRRNGGDGFYSNLILQNDETGRGGLQIRAALTRGVCENTTIGKAIIDLEHRRHSPEQFEEAIGEAIGLLHQFSQEMMATLEQAREIAIEHPLAAFQELASRLKMPPRAQEQALQYFEEEEGSEPNLFAIWQAVTAGSQALTRVQPGSRKRPSWTARHRIETGIQEQVDAIVAAVDEGQTVDEVLECEYCHTSLADRERVHIEAE